MSDIERIKDAIDVADLVGEYVQLKPAGINKKGLCPFHHEKTPSFMVSSERRRWHCFGCAKGGDIFSFVQEIEGMEFVEALKFLANRAGIELTQRKNDIHTSQKNRIKEINTIAASFFHQVLLRLPISASARSYLLHRGLTGDSIERWQIGFIPDQWDLLTQYLLKKGFGIDDLVASGLTIRRDHADPVSRRGFYDRFRGRIMFPISDVHGTIVGFTGRVLVETETSGGKYVNTPQTQVYDKSRVLFGLDKAKQEIRRKDMVVMVEGQMDVIACHQAGMTHVVATSGTAMTEEQIKLLKRYSMNVAIAFDGDVAGQHAAKRGFDIALAGGMNIKIISLPEGVGKDADECLKRDPTAWFLAVEKANSYLDWRFSRAFVKRNTNDPKERQAIADDLLPDIGRIPYAVERDYWLRELGGRLNVDVSVLKEDMVRLEKKERSPVGRGGESEQPPAQPTRSRLETLIERLFVLLFRFPSLLSRPLPSLDMEMLSTTPFTSLYRSFLSAYTTATPASIDVLRHVLECTGKEEITDTLLLQGDLLFVDFSESAAKKEWEALIDEIKKEWQRCFLTTLSHEIAEAEKIHDASRVTLLQEKFRIINF